MARSVLVIAAHPDDEVLGCGGTVALHARAGDEVTAVIACEGESLRYGPGGVGQSEHSRRAAEMLGLKESRPLGFPDQRLDTLTLLDLIAPLERAVREVRPAVVYCQFGGDANRDPASSTEWGYPRSFVPDTWVDISTTLEQKLCAMACYESEVRPYPHPRSLEALRHRAHAWGNQCCMEAAEVFMTVRRTLRTDYTPGR